MPGCAPRPRRVVAVGAALCACVSTLAALSFVPAATAEVSRSRMQSPATPAGSSLPAAAHAAPRNVDGWWYDALHLAAAQRQATGAGVTVGLIDATLDTGTPELRGADVHLERNCNGWPAHSRPGAEQDHGSGMAALLVGSGRGPDGTPGIRGVAPGATVRFYGLDLEAEKAGQAPFIECDGILVAAAVRMAVDDGADILSMSIGTNASSRLKTAVRYALDRGVVVVAAGGDLGVTGRHGQIDAPASIPGVVAVNAADREARPWTGNPPPTITDTLLKFPVITAPGVDVATTRYVDGRGWASGVETVGTSPATAIVAGSLALVKQKYPDATGSQLVQHLIHFTGGTRPFRWDRDFGFGIVSVREMLAHDPTRWPDRNPLLRGPRRAVRDYPMSDYRDAAATGGSGSEGTASGTTAGSGSEPTAGSGSSGPSAAEAAADRDAGVPVWLVAALAALVAIVLLAAGATTLRRARGERGGRTNDTSNRPGTAETAERAETGGR